MTSAAEVFTIELARASRKANRFIRHLPRDVRDDILQAALMWCWEHRESFSLTTSIETWFVNAVRDAYKARQRSDELSADFDEQLTEDTVSNDDPEWNAIVAESVEELRRNMDPIDQLIVTELLDGATQEEAATKLGIRQSTVSRRLDHLRTFLPDGVHERMLLRRAVTEAAPESDDVESSPSAIDRELEKLDFPPEHGAECPPCWRCKWFEGYLPGQNKSVRVTIVEDDVRAAVARTEAEKVRIANEVRDGRL